MSSIFGVALKKKNSEQMLIWVIVSYIWFITVKQVVQNVFFFKWLAFSDGKETPILKKKMTVLLWKFSYIEWSANLKADAIIGAQSWYIYLQADSVKKGESTLDQLFEQSLNSSLRINNFYLHQLLHFAWNSALLECIVDERPLSRTLHCKYVSRTRELR